MAGKKRKRVGVEGTSRSKRAKEEKVDSGKPVGKKEKQIEAGCGEDEFAALEQKIFEGVEVLGATKKGKTVSASKDSDSDDFMEVKPKGKKSASKKKALSLDLEGDDFTAVKPKGKKASEVKKKALSFDINSDDFTEVKPKSTAGPAKPVPDSATLAKMDVASLLEYGERLGSYETNVSQEVDSDDDESEWEEVEALDDGQKPYEIPKDGVQITIENPAVSMKRKKKGFDLEAYMRRQLNQIKREIQVDMHKVHLLCLVAHGRYVNNILNSQFLLAAALSLIPSEQCYPPKRIDMDYLTRFMSWFRKKIALVKGEWTQQFSPPLEETLQERFGEKAANTPTELVFMFVVVLRALGVEVRLIMSLHPLPLKIKLSHAGKSTSDSASTSQKDEGNSNDGDVEKESPAGINNGKALLKGGKSVAKNAQKTSTDDSVKKPEETSLERGKSRIKKNQQTGSSMEVQLKADTQTNGKAPSKSSKSSVKKTPSTTMETSLDKNISVRSSRSSTKTTASKSSILPVTKKAKNSSPVNCRKKLRKTKTRVSYIESSSSESEINGSANKDESEPEAEPFGSDSGSDFEVEVQKRKKSGRETSSSDSESDFEPSVRRNSKAGKRSGSSSSSPEEKKSGKKQRQDLWIEVYLEQEEKWLTIDILHEKLHCVYEMEAKATQPVTYILAFNNNQTIKDVTWRYASHWMSHTQKLRVDSGWWKETLKPFQGKRTIRDKMEEEEMDDTLTQRPMPTSISEFKNHPLYALKRHLLKYEAFYPPDVPTLGFIRKEAVYPRECVKTLQSRENWLIKEGKVVRRKEEPYKIVLRPKWDKINKQILKNQPLELFGEWQVEDYIPPPAVDGKVPRNEYGNVELFKPTMLPKGTVHLHLPGLNRVAKKLDIDCAQAMVGFDITTRGVYPMFDGFVVCEEFKEIIIDAWNQEQDEQRKKEREKKEKRAIQNWKKLTKGLIIRERLKAKYGYEFGETSSGKKSKEGGSTKAKKTKSAPE